MRSRGLGIFIRTLSVLFQIACVSLTRADVQYSYDAAGRLVQAAETAGASVQYQYDISGNLTSIARVGVEPAPVPDPVTPVTVNTSLKVSFATSKRFSIFSFEGVQGAGYSLVLIGFRPASSRTALTAKVLRPDGTVFWDCGSFSASAGNCDIGPLPSSGTYAVRIDASGAAALSFNLVLTRDQTGTLVVGALPVAFTTVAAGQNIRYTFAGNANQGITFSYSRNTIGSGTIQFYRTDGSLWTTLALGGSSGSRALTLPATGTYTIAVLVNGSSTGHADIQLRARTTRG